MLALAIISTIMLSISVLVDWIRLIADDEFESNSWGIVRIFVIVTIWLLYTG